MVRCRQLVHLGGVGRGTRSVGECGGGGSRHNLPPVVSCSHESREHRFLVRVEHIRSFLMDQARAPGGHGAPARAAVTSADGDTDIPAPPDDGGADGCVGSLGGPASAAPSAWECRLRVARADFIAAVQGHGRKGLAPPEHFGDSPHHLTAHTLEFRTRKEKGECFACSMRDVKPALPRVLATRQGTSPKDREDPLWRVTGAALPGKAF